MHRGARPTTTKSGTYQPINMDTLSRGTNPPGILSESGIVYGSGSGVCQRSRGTLVLPVYFARRRDPRETQSGLPMPSPPSHWTIYREYVCPLRPRIDGFLIQHRALAPLGYGHPLWSVFSSSSPQAQSDTSHRNPGPIHSYKRVRLGDIGYIRQGRFHLLFSAGVELGSRVLGTDVPPTFEPLDVGPIISGGVRPSGCLRTDTVRQIETDVGGSAIVPLCVQKYLGLAENHRD